MLVVETIARIRRDHLVKGVPIKKIARDLRVSKNTVRKVVRGDETSYSYERKIQPLPKLGPWVEELERRLEANEKKPRRDRFSLLRIHEDLAALGYGGGYDAVRRYARTWRRRWRLLSPSQGFVPLSFDPGEAYQFDWSHEYARLSGVTTKVKAAHMRLCYSRMQLVQIFPRESQEMVFEAHERAFHFFGGVCRRGIYDNMKTAVSMVFVGKERAYNRRFLELCSHHLVEPVACTPGAGWEKGQVERQVGDVRGRLFVPIPRGGSYAEINAWLMDRCIEDAKKRPHPTIEGNADSHQSSRRFSINVATDSHQSSHPILSMVATPERSDAITLLSAVLLSRFPLQRYHRRRPCCKVEGHGVRAARDPPRVGAARAHHAVAPPVPLLRRPGAE